MDAKPEPCFLCAWGRTRSASMEVKGVVRPLARKVCVSGRQARRCVQRRTNPRVRPRTHNGPESIVCDRVYLLGECKANPCVFLGWDFENLKNLRNLYYVQHCDSIFITCNVSSPFF